MQFSGFLNCVEPIRHFADELQFCMPFEHRADRASPGLEMVCLENVDSRGRHRMPSLIAVRNGAHFP